ncbi:MAG: Ig domain-containing protein [Clostridia bacterium]|nr:Ig domain-containing protein [Clostridia bacterium]
MKKLGKKIILISAITFFIAIITSGMVQATNEVEIIKQEIDVIKEKIDIEECEEHLYASSVSVGGVENNINVLGSSKMKEELKNTLQEQFSEQLGYDIEILINHDAKINMSNFNNVNWKSYIGKNIKEITEVKNNWSIDIPNEKGLFKDDNNKMNSDYVFVLPEKVQKNTTTYIVLVMVDAELKSFITQKLKNIEFAYATITITMEEDVKEEIVEVNSLKIIGKNLLYVNEYMILETEILPQNATNKTIKWTSSDEEIATVDNRGRVEAIKAGDVIITAETSNGIKQNIKINIKEIEVESVEIIGNKSLKVGESIPLEIKVLPQNATHKTVTWTSSDEETAIVDENGKVTGKKAGQVIITAKAHNGVKSVITIEVEENTEKITGVTLIQKLLNKIMNFINNLLKQLISIMTKR